MNKYAYFSIVVATTLVLCFATFALLSGKPTDAMVIGFAINFPLCLLLCIVYYKIISVFSRVSFMQRHTPLRVACDWLCATAVGSLFSFTLRMAMGADGDWRKPTMTFVLWNSMAVMA